jgi:type 1 fimbria pilin
MKKIIAAMCCLSLAISSLAYAHGNEAHIQGTVVSATDSTIVVKTAKGNQTLMIDANTKVTRGKSRAVLADVKAGDRVVIHPMKHADHVMAAEIQLATPKQSK